MPAKFLRQAVLPPLLAALVFLASSSLPLSAQEAAATDQAAAGQTTAGQAPADQTTAGQAPAGDPGEPAAETQTQTERNARLLEDSALTPGRMLEEPPLTEEDFDTFFRMCAHIFDGRQSVDPAAFIRLSDELGVGLRRMNYIAAKISLHIGLPERKATVLAGLGPGVLMNGEEKAIFNSRKEEIDEVREAMRKALSY
ncbi:MAG: hypothetical protein LBP95_06565 [Deltaproteobacteria bacterium]|jgi:hypothetical protein|nr:hypothetical protein [Deltaproteobacteria bacterium]